MIRLLTNNEIEKITDSVELRRARRNHTREFARCAYDEIECLAYTCQVLRLALDKMALSADCYDCPNSEKCEMDCARVFIAWAEKRIAEEDLARGRVSSEWDERKAHLDGR